MGEGFGYGICGFFCLCVVLCLCFVYCSEYVVECRYWCMCFGWLVGVGVEGVFLGSGEYGEWLIEVLCEC